METQTTEQGKKYDTGKPDWSLMPLNHIEEVVKVLTFGASKYGKWNWQKLDNAQSRYFSAAMRHLTAYQQGEEFDKESGLSHLAHCMCNLVFLMEINSNKSI